MKYHIIAWMALVAALFAFASCKDSNEERCKVLKIYNWADYIDEDVLQEFPAWYKEQTGEEVRIVYQVFDINEIMLTKIERGHEDFDVVCPSEYIIERPLSLYPEPVGQNELAGHEDNRLCGCLYVGDGRAIVQHEGCEAGRCRELALPVGFQVPQPHPDEGQLP